MTIEERVEVAILMKYYGGLLTEKQREVVSLYVDDNLSLAEVSEELKISRQAVKDSLDKTYEALKDAEEKLNFIKRDNSIKELIENNKEMSQSTKLKLISKLEE